MIGSIHSHQGASAFQSGTDSNDEITFPGLHITIGKIMQAIPDIHVRMQVGPDNKTLDPNNIITLEPSYEDYTNYSYYINELDNFIESGMKHVKKEVRKVTYSRYGNSWYANDWEEYYDNISYASSRYTVPSVSQHNSKHVSKIHTFSKVGETDGKKD